MVKINSVSDYPVDPDALVIRDLLQRILDTTVSVYDSMGVPLPARRYWCLGQAAEDCAQLTVVMVGATLGSPGDQQVEPMPCNGPKFVTVQVNVTRDIPQGPNGDPARPERLQEASAWPAVDSWVLLNNIQSYNVSHLGHPVGTGVLAAVTNPPPNGFVQTTTLTLSLGVL